MKWNLPDKPAPLRSVRFFIALGLFLFVMGVGYLFRSCGDDADIRRSVRRGDVANVIAALNANPSLISCRDHTHRASLLHIATDVDQWESASILLERGADVDARDKYGMTALHKAAIFNRTNIASLLLEEHADINAFAPKYGQIQVTPLHLAAEVGAVEMVALLLAQGAATNPQPPGGPVNPSPLHLAAAKGQFEAAKILLDHGADPDAKDRNGRTPETWAAEMDELDVEKLLRNAPRPRDPEP